MAQSKMRNSGIEILRLLSMFLIVLSHFYIHGEFEFNNVTANKILLQVISFGGKLGVDCFVLITGYYMAKSKFRTIKLADLALKVWLYSWIPLVLLMLFAPNAVTGTIIFKSVLPISNGTYWFITTFMILYCLLPFINKLVTNLSLEQHKILTVLIFLFMSVIPIIWLVQNKRMASVPIENIGWFILLVLIGSYIKRKETEETIKHRHWGLWAIVFYLMIALTNLTFNLIGIKFPIVAERATFFGSANSPLLLLCGISLFMFFKDRFKSNIAWINAVSTATLDVYLIHENIIVLKYLWVNWLNVSQYESHSMLIVYAIIISMLVFIACLLIGNLFSTLIIKPIIRLLKTSCINDIFKKIDCKMNVE